MGRSLNYDLHWPPGLFRLTSLLSTCDGPEPRSRRSPFLRFILETALRLQRPMLRLARSDAHLAATVRHESVHRSTRALEIVARRATDAGKARNAYSNFQQIVVPQLDAAYNFARFLARDADAAQDIVQEAFLKAYRGFDGYRGGDVRAWLFTIVRNCYHDWRLERRRKLRFEVDLADGKGPDKEDGVPAGDVASDEDTPEAALIRKSESEAVRAALYSLPRPLREILVLREFEDLSYREIAEVTALPIGTVMSRLARARRALGEAWRLLAPPREDRS